MRIISSLLLCLVIFSALLIGCAPKGKAEASAAPQASSIEAVTVPESSPAPEDTAKPEPIYPEQLAEGVYEINVDSSSSMFRVVKCTLTVANGQMTAAMTMSGQGYGMVYMGTGEQALKADKSEYILFETDEDGAKFFTVPVKALNQQTDCAAWSIKKEKWYDRVLVFESDMIPEQAIAAR